MATNIFAVDDIQDSDIISDIDPCPIHVLFYDPGSQGSKGCNVKVWVSEGADDAGVEQAGARIAYDREEDEDYKSLDDSLMNKERSGAIEDTLTMP